MGRRVAMGVAVAAGVFLLILAGAGLKLRSLLAEDGVTPQPLTESRLLAIVAGNSLPEDIAPRIRKFGLAFAPSAPYRALLVSAGTDERVLAAYDAAKPPAAPVETQAAPPPPAQPPAPPIDMKGLQHLADAAPLVKTKRYDDAARAVNAAIAAGVDRTDCAFVMGEIIRQRQDFPQALTVYQKILADAPNFPEAEVKLSYLLYRFNDPQEALRLATHALHSGAAIGEAHKNAGLALEEMRKFRAAQEEYEAALAVKPDYPAALLDLGNNFKDAGQLTEAIDYYKRASALSPDEADIHGNLGAVYFDMGDLDSAIREYREAKRLDPTQMGFRNSLGQSLVHHGDYAGAVQEFKELVELHPDYTECHDCYGTALFYTWDFDGAEAQYRIATQIDPNDQYAHSGLGAVREQQKRYDEALAEYKKATELDDNLADPYAGSGRVYMAQEKYPDAIAILKRGVEQRPDSAKLHELLAQAMAGSGNSAASKGAIEEGKASVALDPTNIQTMLHLAGDYEKSGDWVNAIVEYREASLAAANVEMRGKVFRADEAPEKAQAAYKDAQARWQTHLTALRAAGKSQEAAALEAKLKSAEAAPGVADQVDEVMKAGAAADKVRNFSEAVTDFKRAVDLAETMQPHDSRLVTALDKLGNNEMGQDNVAAKAAYEREYKEASALFGARSGSASQALQSLARFETFTKDYSSAEHHYFQAVDIATKNFGEGSDEAAKATLAAASVYFAQKDYAKAEPYVLRAVRSEQAIFGKDNPDVGMYLTQECYMYDQWGKAKEADACYQQVLPLLEKQYGKNSPVEVTILMQDAKQLRGLGRTSDADAMEKRVAAIRSGTMAPN